MNALNSLPFQSIVQMALALRGVLLVNIGEMSSSSLPAHTQFKNMKTVRQSPSMSIKSIVYVIAYLVTIKKHL